MCDCEELEFEDFQTMLQVIKQVESAKKVEVAPLAVVSGRRK